MTEEKTEGLLLQSIPYLGTQTILKIFTPEQGLLSLIVKKGIFQPFCIGEWVYIEKAQGLYPLKDASIFEYFVELRNDFKTLSSAGKIGRALLQSQLPGKGGNLYALAVAYFKKLSQFSHPETLVSSFLLKLLMHDGLLSLKDTCSECGEKASILTQGESFCRKHSSTESIFFSEEEFFLAHQLTFTKTFQTLQALEISKTLQDKIEKLFENR
jgi:DNA repair protein RecO (recombination protein O)